MEYPTLTLEKDQLYAPPAALLLLRRGAGTRTAWSFREDDSGSRVTVGASPSCDFRIIARGVAPLELSFVFTGEGLYVQSARPCLGARVDGVVLGREWMRLGHDACIELGDARMDVILAGHEAKSVEATEEAFFDPQRAPNEPEQREPVRDSALPLEADKLECVLDSSGVPSLPRSRVALAAFGLVSAYALWLALLDRL